MKRWLPFILLISIVIIMTIRFFVYGRTDPYNPQTSDPQLIYSQACSGCHGEKGEGSGFLYPNLLDSTLSRQKIIEAVRDGNMLMPAFPMIQDTSLSKLARYLTNENFRSR